MRKSGWNAAESICDRHIPDFRLLHFSQKKNLLYAHKRREIPLQIRNAQKNPKTKAWIKPQSARTHFMSIKPSFRRKTPKKQVKKTASEEIRTEMHAGTRRKSAVCPNIVTDIISQQAQNVKGFSVFHFDFFYSNLYPRNHFLPIRGSPSP